MKVRLLVSRSGTDGAFAPGDVIEVDAAEARRMVDAGQCEVLAADPVKERAVPRRATEKAAK